MANIHWLKAVSGSFGNRANWAGGVAPGAHDDAILDAAGAQAYTATVSADKTVNAIETAADATLRVSNGNIFTAEGDDIHAITGR